MQYLVALLAPFIQFLVVRVYSNLALLFSSSFLRSTSQSQ